MPAPFPDPPVVTGPPTPPPTQLDPLSFDARADAYHIWLPSGFSGLTAAMNWIKDRCAEVFLWAGTAQENSAICAAAAANPAVVNAAANAAAAAASATAAGVYAAAAQAVTPDSPMRFNSINIKADITVPPQLNAVSGGSIFIEDGINVIVSDFSTWSIT